MSTQYAIFAGRDDRKAVEEGLELAPKFDEKGLLPAVAVDAATGRVLMLAYMNAQALAKTLEIGEAVYWSRSRNELWHKGATSGLTQKVREVLVDCDQDAIVLKVDVQGQGCCHVGYSSCFFRSVELKGASDAPAKLTYVESEKAFDPEKVYGKK